MAETIPDIDQELEFLYSTIRHTANIYEAPGREYPQEVRDAVKTMRDRARELERLREPQPNIPSHSDSQTAMKTIAERIAEDFELLRKPDFMEDITQRYRNQHIN